MKPVTTETTNLILKGPEGSDVIDLPVTRIQYGDGQQGVESCWQLSPEELEEVKRTGKIFLIVLGTNQPPVCVSPYSSLTGQAEGQYDTDVEPNDKYKGKPPHDVRGWEPN